MMRFTHTERVAVHFMNGGPTGVSSTEYIMKMFSNQSTKKTLLWHRGAAGGWNLTEYTTKSNASDTPLVPL